MEFKGTKGKWGIRKGTFGFQKNCTFILSDELDICLLYKVNSPDEEEYNAQLISKTPEMLELINEFYLMCIQKTFPTEHELEYMAEKAKQLIKEATEL